MDIYKDVQTSTKPAERARLPSLTGVGGPDGNWDQYFPDVPYRAIA